MIYPINGHFIPVISFQFQIVCLFTKSSKLFLGKCKFLFPSSGPAPQSVVVITNWVYLLLPSRFTLITEGPARCSFVPAEFSLAFSHLCLGFRSTLKASSISSHRSMTSSLSCFSRLSCSIISMAVTRLLSSFCPSRS